MELHLGLALSSSSSSASSSSLPYNHESMHLKKRKHVPQTLPLLVWKDFFCNKNKLIYYNDNEGDGDDEVQSNSIHHRNVGGVIGWPPVKLCRRNVRHTGICNRGCSGDSDGEASHEDHGGSKSMYVKVHMEGVGIARKIDLNQHQSYQTLVHTLASMFGKCHEDVKLTYQDKEGDWLLAGDVPWGSFIKTIQRLRLIKK